jgi:hypothetical protein
MNTFGGERAFQHGELAFARVYGRHRLYKIVNRRDLTKPD